MKFRKKPVVIEAMQFIGSNWKDVLHWADIHETPMEGNEASILIDTLEGEMTAGVGDWSIRGIGGEFYPCKPDIFTATYDAVEQFIL